MNSIKTVRTGTAHLLSWSKQQNFSAPRYVTNVLLLLLTYDYNFKFLLIQTSLNDRKIIQILRVFSVFRIFERFAG